MKSVSSLYNRDDNNFAPRLGFAWDPSGKGTWAIRGGGGIFGAGTPDVYVGNAFSVSGVLSSTLTIRQTDGGRFIGISDPAIGQQILTGVNIDAVNPLAQQAIANSDPTVSTTTSVNAIDPNFKIPSQWRATLSGTYKADLGPLGDGWNFSVDGFYSKVRQQVLISDIRSMVPPISLIAATESWVAV